MAVRTGINGAIDGIPCLQRFTILHEAPPESVDAGCTDGGPSLSKTNEDWLGIAVATGSQPSRMPGATFAFSGYDGADLLAGNAIMDWIKIIWEVEEANRLYHQLQFSGTGQLSAGAGSETDAGTPNPVSARGMGVKIDGTLFNIRKAELKIWTGNASYNDTGTNGYTGRAVGNHFATFKILAYLDSFATMPARGSFKQLLFQTVAGAGDVGWKLDYGYISKAQPTVSIRSDENGVSRLNAVEIEGHWSAWYGTIQGTIVAPDGATTLYPAA